MWSGHIGFAAPCQTPLPQCPFSKETPSLTLAFLGTPRSNKRMCTRHDQPYHAFLVSHRVCRRIVLLVEIWFLLPLQGTTLGQHVHLIRRPFLRQSTWLNPPSPPLQHGLECVPFHLHWKSLMSPRRRSSHHLPPCVFQASCPQFWVYLHGQKGLGVGVYHAKAFHCASPVQVLGTGPCHAGPARTAARCHGARSDFECNSAYTGTVMG